MRYTESDIWQVWSKGEIFAGNDPVFWRKDTCGAWMFRGDYENYNSEYGWVISQITPLKKGGTDDISNLYPLHIENTSRDESGHIVCKMTAAGIHNNIHTQPDLQNTNLQISKY